MRVFAARARQALGQDLHREIGAKIDDQRMAGLLTQALRQRVDGAALDTLLGDHQFTTHAVTRIGEADVLDWRSGKLVAEDFRPLDEKAAVGGLESIDANACGFQHRHPLRIRSQMRPRCATKGENGGRAVESLPARAGDELGAKPIEPLEPGAEQRRGFHLLGEDAAR